MIFQVAIYCILQRGTRVPGENPPSDYKSSHMSMQRIEPRPLWLQARALITKPLEQFRNNTTKEFTIILDSWKLRLKPETINTLRYFRYPLDAQIFALNIILSFRYE